MPGYDDTPFDITGYRYLSYDITDPSKTMDDLIKTLKETIETDRPDSLFSRCFQAGITRSRKIFSVAV
jgi:hypothetical protein